MRVLLLNPPFPKPVLRDYFCGTTSKGGYFWPPIDLIVQSGFLHEAGCGVSLVDAAARGLSEKAALHEIAQARPDVIYALTATPGFHQDMAFLQVAKNLSGAKLVVGGEPAMAWDATAFEQFDHVDAVLGDFTSPDLAKWLTGEAHGGALVAKGQGTATPAVRRTGGVRFPLPRHDLFLTQPYRHPFLGRGAMGTLLMAYGCPHHCAYCNSGFHSLGFARRTLEDVLEESDQLRHAGAKRLYMKDMSFGADPHFADALLRGWLKRGVRWPWAAWVRLDSFEMDLLAKMKETGCRGIQVGLEAVDVGDLKEVHRPQNRDTMDQRVKQAAALGLKVGGHFVLGLPGQTAVSMEETVVWALSLPLTYASFNVYTPRHNTGAEVGEAASRDASRGGAGADPAAVRLQQHAVRRFYGRPAVAVKTAGLWLRQAGLL